MAYLTRGRGLDQHRAETRIASRRDSKIQAVRSDLKQHVARETSSYTQQYLSHAAFSRRTTPAISMSSAASTAVSIHSPSPDDAEKGLADQTLSSLPVSTLSLTKKEDNVIVNVLPKDLLVTTSQSRAKPQPTVARRILFALWFNTYRCVTIRWFNVSHTDHVAFRKFFVFTFSLNIIGIALAASGHWPYAVNYTSALILGNIHVAVLVRNELFGRFLYLVVNTLFAKARQILL